MTAARFRKRYPGVKVSVSVPRELLWVPMDVILIEQVLTNLLENAVIHGKTTTEIHMGAERAKGHVRFFVADNGQGIAPADMERLFDGSMKHSETAAGDMKRNMGIGLSVCMAVVKAHDGTMNAKNRENAPGAEFEFYLPLEEEHQK